MLESGKQNLPNILHHTVVYTSVSIYQLSSLEWEQQRTALCQITWHSVTLCAWLYLIYDEICQWEVFILKQSQFL